MSDTEHGPASDEEKVEMWRKAECLRLGLEEDLAQEFAESKGELAFFRSLVEDRGWTAEAAFRVTV